MPGNKYFERPNPRGAFAGTTGALGLVRPRDDFGPRATTTSKKYDKFPKYKLVMSALRDYLQLHRLRLQMQTINSDEKTKKPILQARVTNEKRENIILRLVIDEENHIVITSDNQSLSSEVIDTTLFPFLFNKLTRAQKGDSDIENTLSRVFTLDFGSVVDLLVANLESNESLKTQQVLKFLWIVGSSSSKNKEFKIAQKTFLQNLSNSPKFWDIIDNLLNKSDPLDQKFVFFSISILKLPPVLKLLEKHFYSWKPRKRFDPETILQMAKILSGLRTSLGVQRGHQQTKKRNRNADKQA